MKISVEKINKSFDNNHVLHDVSFEVVSGRAMGFLGRNGSGKTTTIRCIMDIFKPDSGQILIDGKKFRPKEYQIGYLPEERGMYAKQKILDQLIYFGQLKGASKEESKASAEHWLERFELLEHGKSNLEILSKGNQQKVQIIQAFLNDPDIIILDEPFSGLDPVNADLFKKSIRQAIDRGKLVIFSSHQMSYVEEFCDDITLIHHGHILINGSLDLIKSKMGLGKYRLAALNFTSSELKRVVNQLSFSERLIVTEDKQSLIIDLDGIEQNYFLGKLLEKKVKIKIFSVFLPTLTDIFLEYVNENDEIEKGWDTHV